MKYTCKTCKPQELTKYRSECLIVGVHTQNKLSPWAKYLDKFTNKVISRFLSYGDFEGKIGQSCLLYDLPGITAKRVLIVGCGDNMAVSITDLTKITHSIIKVVRTLNIRSIACLLDHMRVEKRDNIWVMRQCTLNIENELQDIHNLSEYKESTARTKCKTWNWLQLQEVNQTICKQAITEAVAMARGSELTKTLGNLPSNICTPTYLATQARQLAQKYPKLSTKVLNTAQMSQLGMGALLAVGQGSEQPPKLIELHYRGGKNKAPIVLIGKGITFDSGGISLKPGSCMDEMKFDMLGAATVIGTIKAIAELNLPLNVIGLLATAENMPSGNAIKPGDVVKSLSGKTIEILNTDAEGRLVLCDAITYSQRFKPQAVIDVATLTGAAIVALGHEIAPLMGNNETLCQKLDRAAKETSDQFWRLPLPPNYQQKLQTNFADLANVATTREAGTIIAGCFLSSFAEKLTWAHIDIAGIAWQSGKQKGASGRPVAALTQYLINQC